jgi:ABC-type nitrate/sulfonate/bicarbonate transport system permease component
MMAATKGLGFLLSASGQKFDITGMYATLFILMGLGLLAGEAGARIEGALLRWRRKHR